MSEDPSLAGRRLAISIHPERSYLRVIVTGDYDFGDARRLYREAFQAAARHERKKILLDLRGVEGAPTTVDRFEIGELHASLKAELFGSMDFQIATVGNIPLIDPRRMGELVARNRGINAKVVTNLQEALAWLEVELEE